MADDEDLVDLEATMRMALAATLLAIDDNYQAVKSMDFRVEPDDGMGRWNRLSPHHLAVHDVLAGLVVVAVRLATRLELHPRVLTVALILFERCVRYLPLSNLH